MVCAKCEAAERASKKSTGLAVTDVWKPAGSGSDQRNERKIGTNKLLEARKRYAAPAPKAGSALKGGAGVGPMRGGSSSSKDQPFGKCKVCKVTVAKEGAKMCQSKSVSWSVLALPGHALCLLPLLVVTSLTCLFARQDALTKKASAQCAKLRSSIRPSTR